MVKNRKQVFPHSVTDDKAKRDDPEMFSYADFSLNVAKKSTRGGVIESSEV